MITNTAEFETAVDEIADLLDKPFEREDSERLALLMRDVQAYQPAAASADEPEGPQAQRARALQERVEAFRDRLRRERHLMGDLGVALGLFEEGETPDGAELRGRGPTFPGSPGV
ncbi:MAG: hypothetical protein K1X35_13775 [Caulobacteraceae bacterium]|nr:hypothetical protein [Caulobacteraceae bacterium]